jgi:sugar phosphate isomerase/epimerase
VKNRLGVCSWSLRPSSPLELAERVEETGLTAVQLALDPLRTGEWSPDATVDALAARDLVCLSGMMGTEGEDYSTLETIRRTGGVRPDDTWEANRAAASANARLARRLGLDLVSFHAGFLPEEPGPERTKLIGRLREVVDRFADEGVRAAFETGQETAVTLLAVLEELDRPSAGVNFDPANMLLYDRGDPIEALRVLAPRVHQVHVKDALRTQTPGTWGEEVRAGSGQVDWEAFFRLVRELPIEGDLVIEREAGEDRLGDVAHARDLVRRLLGGEAG